MLPVDIDRGEVVLIEQFRPGAMAAGWEPWLIECVAGVVETGESTADVAVREASEEAGCAITALHAVSRFLSSPGACTESVEVFCGRVDASNVGGIHGLAEEGEDIRVQTLRIAEAIKWLDQGRIVNAKTIIALHWLARYSDELRALWSGPHPKHLAVTGRMTGHRVGHDETA